jgi:flagellar biogenesis protein FliO
MPAIVVILSLLLSCIACAPAAAQSYPAANDSARPAFAPSAYTPLAGRPAPVDPPPPSPPLDDRQVRPASYSQPAAGNPSGGIPLAPPSPKFDAPAAAAGRSGSAERGGLPSPLAVAGSLVFVLGLFLVVAWIMRRATPGNVRLLPKEVVEVLGRAPLAARQQIHLLRCGHKLLLISASPAGVETLTEITDPLEVDRLAGLCQQTRPDSATAMFRQVFEQLAETPRRAARRGASRPLRDDVELANAGIPGDESDALEDRHV